MFARWSSDHTLRWSCVPYHTKQGMLPLTFADPADYDKITGSDTLDILGLVRLDRIFRNIL